MIDKKKVDLPDNGIFFSTKKKRAVTTMKDTEEPEATVTKWETPA